MVFVLNCFLEFILFQFLMRMMLLLHATSLTPITTNFSLCLMIWISTYSQCWKLLSFDSLFNYLDFNISFYKTSWTNVSSIHSISQFLLIITLVYFENSVLLGTIFILPFLQSNTSDPILLKCLNTWPRLLNYIQTLLLNKTDHFQENGPFF